MRENLPSPPPAAPSFSAAATPARWLPRDYAALIALAVTLLAALLTLLYFHDRFWLSRDDGYFAHIAERILNGEVLHRDVQALHPGYVYDLNALALYVFGHNLVSLRYPLIASGLIQTFLVFIILLPRGTVIAMAGGFTIVAITVVQFFSPSAHWYCLPLFFLLVLVLGNRTMRGRLELIGCLLMTLFLFRQLTGVFVAMGTLTYLLLEHRVLEHRGKAGDRAFARVVIAVMLAGLALYLASKADFFAWIAFGICPLLILAKSLTMVAIDNRRTAATLGRLALGAAAAVLPLLLYHTIHGTLTDWFSDAFVDAIALGEFAYQKVSRYGPFLIVAIHNLLHPASAAMVVNGLYWPVLIFAALALGVLTWMRLNAVAPLPLLATFYALVAVHFQAAAYLYFAVGPVFAGLLWYAGALRRPAFAATAAVLYGAAALYYHAGQPITRSYAGLLAGERVSLVQSAIPGFGGLHITPSDDATYQALLRVIAEHSEPGDAILGVPAQSELFFLTGRRNPLRYSFLPFGIRDADTTAAALKTLAARPPKVVVHVPSLPYNTEHTDKIMDWVRGTYVHYGRIREFEVYIAP